MSNTQSRTVGDELTKSFDDTESEFFHSESEIEEPALHSVVFGDTYEKFNIFTGSHLYSSS